MYVIIIVQGMMAETANKEGVVAVDVVEESDNDMHPSSRTNIQMLSKMMHPVNPWTEQLTLLPSPQWQFLLLSPHMLLFQELYISTDLHHYPTLCHHASCSIMLCADGCNG